MLYNKSFTYYYKGGLDMKKFDIIKLNIADVILVQTLVSESPFDFILEIQQELNMIGFEGNVIIDELLHSGNNEERFIKVKFINGGFAKDSFQFINIQKQDPIRKHINKYLREHTDELQLSGLTSYQISMIKQGCIV